MARNIAKGWSRTYRMSRNAVEAYQAGLRPASKIKGVPLWFIRILKERENHHTEGSLSYSHNNPCVNSLTKFYCPNEVRQAWCGYLATK